MIWLLMTRESFLEINTDNYLPGFGDSLTFDLQGKSFVYLLRENPNIYSCKLRDLQLNKVPIMSTEKSLCLSLRGGGIRLNLNRKEST
ncbi:MAG: hypothetical protein F6K23_02835 [Okeania sp. SIO2C9]|uniref:hypothetical protein n=1 Tax=Okeania sp. SIO2C9 TaxID=2607791 RepID=UPI0013BF780A|nr:hypothetical protein [Okeania sp. SIO2C9]NEQ72104.1 hypothetical protein [Okeania sp. SIO2C9]